MSHSVARQEFVRLLEYTLHGAELTRADLARVCALARERGVASVCVHGSRLLQAVHFLDESEVKITCSIAFPYGACEADVKRYETEVAVDGGAHFIEVAANLGRLKDGDDAYVLREFRDIVEAADERAVSVYLNTMLLTPDEIRRASLLATEADMKGITLTAALNLGTTIEAVRLAREAAGPALGIKVDQDLFKLAEVVGLLDAGVTRFGVVDDAPLLDKLD